MKKIYLIRHAKSSWKKDFIEDFDRNLNKRGKEDAPFMAERLKQFGVKPDLIYSSPAKRAKKTAKIIAKILDYDTKNIQYKNTLYNGNIAEYLEVLKNTPNYVNELFLIGHNPTITELGEILSNSILTNMPTCSIVCILFNVESFEEIDMGRGEICFFDYPKKHKRGK